MFFRQVFDDTLAQYAYLIGCERTREALIIDPERDIDRYVQLAEENGFAITAVAETHIHADFLSGAREFADRYDVTLYLSDEGSADWKYEWIRDSAYQAVLLRNDDTFRVGNIILQAVHTPGHTPEHLSYLVTDAGGGASAPMGMLTGDFVFVGDVGRPDLLETAAGYAGTMQPAARRLYASMHQFLNLEEYLQVWPGHGAGSACGKALGSVPETTVGYERRFSPAVDAARQGETAFVEYILSGQPEPPFYFARMKMLNKQGPPILGRLPQPRELDLIGLDTLAKQTGVTIIDTRPDRQDFMQAHLDGALYAPLDRSFPTIAGSYVEPGKPIYLIAEASEVEEAVRRLVRVGLDAIEAYATPATLKNYGRTAPLRTTEIIDFEALEWRRHEQDMVVVDVRQADEYEAGHVPGAVHLPHTLLPARLGELPSDKTLLVHCASGARASAATALLERTGHKVIVVNDEFVNWRRRHRQIESETAV